LTTESTIYSCHGLSIILPVYNGESYINEAIDSCLNQNLEHFELIIVDDGSTDSTYENIKAKAKEDNHLVIIKKMPMKD
jgi:glycosyltransferase involved in cell wall biosynthesis